MTITTVTDIKQWVEDSIAGWSVAADDLDTASANITKAIRDRAYEQDFEYGQDWSELLEAITDDEMYRWSGIVSHA